MRNDPERRRPKGQDLEKPDLMEVAHPAVVEAAYHDLDGSDWRLSPRDDEAVDEALQADSDPAAGSDPPASAVTG